jgi:hypothetical protein
MDLAAAAKLPGVVKNLRQNLELRGFKTMKTSLFLNIECFFLFFIEADNMFDLNFSFA